MSASIVSEKAAAPAKATRREWIGLAVLALPCLLYSMDLTVLNLALPALAADLRPSAAELLWIVDIYGFFVAGSLITMGTLGDRIGRRKLLMIGAVAFGLASVLAAFATTAPMLIAARAVLGIAAATLAPSTLSLLRTMFEDPRERAIAIGLWITSFSAGGAIGPLVGGLMLQWFWWGSVFLVALPIMALLLLLGPRLLPEYRDENAGRLDLASAALSMTAVLALIFGLKEIATAGLGLHSMGAISLGLLLGFVFVRRQRMIADPLVDLSLFAVPAFSASLAVNVLTFFAAFASFLMIAQFLQMVLGMSALEAGLWTLPSTAVFIAVAQIAPRFAHRVRPASLLAASLGFAALGFLAMAQVHGDHALAAIVIGTIVTSIGFAPVFTMTTDLIVGSAPKERAGSAAAMAETSSEFGGAAGIAVLGSVMTIVYRLALDGALPDGLPAASVFAAQQGAANALALAGELAEPLAAGVTEAAREAYRTAFAVAATLSAALLAVTAGIAAVLLRGIKPAGEAAQDVDCAPCPAPAE